MCVVIYCTIYANNTVFAEILINLFPKLKFVYNFILILKLSLFSWSRRVPRDPSVVCNRHNIYTCHL